MAIDAGNLLWKGFPISKATLTSKIKHCLEDDCLGDAQYLVDLINVLPVHDACYPEYSGIIDLVVKYICKSLCAKADVQGSQLMLGRLVEDASEIAGNAKIIALQDTLRREKADVPNLYPTVFEYLVLLAADSTCEEDFYHKVKSCVATEFEGEDRAERKAWVDFDEDLFAGTH